MIRSVVEDEIGKVEKRLGRRAVPLGMPLLALAVAAVLVLVTPESLWAWGPKTHAPEWFESREMRAVCSGFTHGRALPAAG